MTNYTDGEIHIWKGGECPVHPQTVVKVWCRYGDVGVGKAGMWVWPHDPDNENRDIIAFQVINPYVEPRKPVERWLLVAKNGQDWISHDLAEADRRQKDYGGTIHNMREVIE